MDEAVRNALANDRVVDITTMGRKSGKPKRLEIWIHAVRDTYFIAGSPGTRDWYANLLVDPSITVHLKKSVTADLPGSARPITDPAEKERLLRAAPGLTTYVNDANLADWVARSPMVEASFG